MNATPRGGAVGQVALAGAAQLLAMTLWFSATAVLPSLQAAWDLGSDGQAWLTAAVQLGFVAGAVGSAALNLPDRLSPRRLIAVAALVGALANLALAWVVSSIEPALVLRFVTGASLACVYPPGMKVVAGHVTGRRRGLAIGILVGAITTGSATPHLVAGLLDGTELGYSAVLTISTVLAICAAFVIEFLVVDGPHAPPSVPFDPKQIGRVLRNRPVLLADLGYCGHMWELYAMWTWLVAYLMLSFETGGERGARVVAFFAIGVAGALGAGLGGWWADRAGRTRVTTVAMAISATCCLVSPWAFGAPGWVVVAFALLWGASAVADSAQFSAAVTELAEPSYVGTALTLQTSMGFALTMITIWGLPYVADVVGWQYAFMVLAPGPALGCVAMMRLRARPEASKMAAGKR